MPHRVLEWLRVRFRVRRYERLLRLLQTDHASGLVLDLGGGPASFFSARYPEPWRVILVDREYGLTRQAKARIPDLKLVVADGECLPFAQGSIGITVCNSVIEHVEDTAAFAREVRRVSDGYFVQTPNGRFPVELHAPVPIPIYRWILWPAGRRLLCRMFGGDFDYVESVHYLTEDELARLFPDAEILRERFLGLTKSFYVIHPPSAW